MQYNTAQDTFIDTNHWNIRANRHLKNNGQCQIRLHVDVMCLDNFLKYTVVIIKQTRCTMREIRETALLHVASGKPARRRYCVHWFRAVDNALTLFRVWPMRFQRYFYRPPFLGTFARKAPCCCAWYRGQSFRLFAFPL